MARTRILDVPTLKSWEDVNSALREIAEEEIVLSDIEGDMNKQINGAKKVAEQDSKPHQDRISKLSKDIKDFTDEHSDELGNAKTKALNFGKVGFRQSTSVTLPKAKEKVAEIIRKLRARKMADCIITKETVNKDILKQYGQDTVNAVGAVYRQKDVFWLEATREKLEKLDAEQR